MRKNILSKRTKDIFQDDTEIDMQEVNRKPDFIDLGFNASTLSNIPGTSNRSEKLNTPFVDYPKDRPIGHLINEVALRYPLNIAIEFKQQSLTYRELNEKSNQLAALLIQNGVAIGQTIGLAVDRSSEMIIALLAIMKAGAAYIPLDPEYPRERVEYMLENSNAAFLITSKKYSRHFKTNASEILIEDSFAQLSSFSNQYPTIHLKGSDLAYILYTSGSTGKPKGVQIEHHSLINFLCSMQKAPGITPADSILAISTISFDISCLELYLPLITGAKIILTDSETARDGHKLLSLLNEKNVTILQATPPTWRMLLDSGWKRRYNFKALCGGEALPKDLAEKLIPLCHSLWNVYGPTETTVWCTIKQVNLDGSPITVGKPIDNMQVYILDERFRKVPVGVTGEIFIGGVGMSRGYASRPDLTAERFLPNPFDKNATSIMYRTGDLGKLLDNGEVQCLGRIDHQVKIRGHRIELGEVEYQLIKLEGVKGAVVVALDDTTGNQKLAAYIVPVSSDVINNQEAEQKSKWREALKELLPHYMIPTDWVILKEFPLTPNNKIDKKALPKPQADLRAEPKKNGRFPATENEKLVAKIWEAEFNCANVTLDDNFFELGGHSIIAVRMMNQLEKETGKRLPLKALFEGPTIEKLAAMIDKNEHNWDSFVTIKATGSKVPIYLIHGVGLNVLIFNPLARHLDSEQPIYGIQAKGLNGIDKLFDRIEDIAAHYISEIIKHNPDGPYAIGGYSFGGIIAFEMSKQLKAMGKKVILTGLFDSYAEQYYRGPRYKKILFKAYEILMRTAYAFYFMLFEPRIVITNKIRFAKILSEKFIDKLLSRRRVEDTTTKGYKKRATQMYQEAFRAYALTPFDGTVDVFRSKKQTYYMPDFKYLGWKPYALKGVTVHDVPGDHLEMFDSPHVEEFARVLQACLDKATFRHAEEK
jgi:amino acid adenylation domain-containing protein